AGAPAVTPERAGRRGGQVEYAYSGAAPRDRPTMEGMLWSDPENEPPEELRDMQRMLRRLGVLVALAMVLTMIVAGLR
ncbi:hypothetical protein SZN_22921, partial [Streptomyces zinciresistens K42]